MFEKHPAPSGGLRAVAAATFGIVLVILVGTALAADKYTLQVPNGLPFSDFKGYENWQVVAASQTEDLLKVMAANPTMMDAGHVAGCFSHREGQQAIPEHEEMGIRRV